MKKSFKDYLLVSIQFFLFGCFTFDLLPHFYSSSFFSNLSLIIATIGILIVSIAIFQLKVSLTVFPSPKQNAVLVTNGLFSFSRHPIYSGVILFCFGYAIYQTSYYKLIISSILLILFYFKTLYEERQLTLKFPNYYLYKVKVGRFFPKLYSFIR